MVIEDETILVNSQGSKMITLNALGGVIWDVLAEPTSLNVVIDGIAERHPQVDRAVIESDVRSFINQTTELGLVRLMS